MAARSNREAVAAQREAMGIVEVAEHGDFSAGDVVGLVGERGQFIIKSIRVYSDGTLRYVTLWGGTKGREQWRSAPSDRIKIQRQRGKSER